MVARQSTRLTVAAGVLVAAVGAVAVGAAHGTALVPSGRHADPAWLEGPLRSLPSVPLGRRGAAALCAVAFAAYVGALRWTAAASARRLVAAIGLAWLLAVLGPLLLSADAFSYLNDARLAAVHHLDPYVAGAGSDPRDPVQPFLG